MNTVRRATPDSEALGSSEDERPWPSSTSFGSLPRKENGVPGLPGGIWSTQRKGSFKLSEAAQRNAAREVRLGAGNPHSLLRTANTPSPATSEGNGTLPFAIPLQPTPKAHRSLSHSQGQREPPQASGTLAGGGSGGPALPLGLLAEEYDDETDDELGGVLTHTVSHPPIGTLQRASTYSAAYDHLYGVNSGRRDSDELGNGQSGSKLGRGLEAAFANLGFDPPQRRSQWQSHLGWDDLPVVNESRRHSLADIPTRRGSLAGDEPFDPMGCGLSNLSARKQRPEISAPSRTGNPTSSYHSDWTRQAQVGSGSSHAPQAVAHDDAGIRNTGGMRYNDNGQGFEIPAIYKVPFVQIAPEELTEDDMRRERQRQASLSNTMPWATTGGGRGGESMRPRKQLFIVSFKCSRVEVFYLLDNTGLDIHEGDIVIVEADRGQDLGTVQHANVTPDQARLYKRKYAEEQYKWLMMFSRNNEPSNVNPNAQLYGESSAMGATRGNGNGNGNGNMLANAPSTIMGLPRENYNNLKPKAIKRLANAHEIKMLGEKEGNEAKAKRTCQQKVAHLHLQMEILDAEWQWDFQKLIFYYYADHYINFKDLITDLYRIYKTRIWLSAVNPASFSQHAMAGPPSAIGPGALQPGGHNGNDVHYTMAYGQDDDPYGAVRPYSIGYETYTPNYPGIPGVPNSFAPAPPSIGGADGRGGYQPNAAPVFQALSDHNTAPSVQPGAQTTGGLADYQFFYNRGEMPAVQPSPMSFNPYANNFYSGGNNNASVSPWNSNTTPTRSNPGLGRQAELPQPIARPMQSVEARLRNLTFGSRFDATHEARSDQYSNGGRDGMDGTEQ